MPPDLETYFQHVFDSIEVFYQEQTAKIFQVMIAATQPLLMMTMVDLETESLRPDYALEAPIEPMKAEEIQSAYETT